MVGRTKKFLASLCSGLVGLVLVVGLDGPALATPPEDVPFWAEIMNRLNAIEAKIDNLETKVDNQTTDLRGVTQNWDKKLDSTNGDANGCNSDRFTCLWPDEDGNLTAVRDNETGIVWERNPDTGTRTWTGAIAHCANRYVGGRTGWSLPMREQLSTLADPTNNNPALPTGHPFLNVQSAAYWSATTLASLPSNAWGVTFFNGAVGDTNKGSLVRAWCVRGGQAYDGQDVLNAIPAP